MSESSLALVLATKEIQAGNLSLDKHTAKTLCNPAANRQRDELLAETENIEQVIGEKSQELATDALVKIKAMLNAAEASRKTAKYPFLHVGKMIDSVATAFAGPLEREEARLKRLVGDYQQELIRKEQEEKRRAAEEQRRIEAEQRRLQEEADRIKREAEEEAKRKLEQAADATSEQQRMKLEEEAQDALAAGQAAQQTADLQNQMLAVQAAEAMPVATVKPTGLSANMVRKFRVSKDPNALILLYSARPELLDLVIRTSDVNRVIREKRDGEYVVASLPGLELYEEADVRIRA